ncbi:hypothetical protein ACHAXH_004533 [Discostella pseudostelligera]
MASFRPIGEQIVGARMYRVLFAFPSLCLAYSWIVYFISHAHDGIQYYDLSSVGWVHALAWVVNFTSFLFLYPSVYNLKEVAAVEKPMVHLWETGIIRITRHPQYIGQTMWSAAHLAMVGTSFTALTMVLLVLHHAFACWNGDRRLLAEHGDNFVKLKERTSIVPFQAIWEGRQILPPDYWKELVRAPLLLIAVGSIGAYFAHPFSKNHAVKFQILPLTVRSIQISTLKERIKDESEFNCQHIASPCRAMRVVDNDRGMQTDMQRNPHGRLGRERSLHARHEAIANTQPVQCMCRGTEEGIRSGVQSHLLEI